MSHTTSVTMNRVSIMMPPPTLDVLTYQSRATGKKVPEVIRGILEAWAQTHPQYRSDLARVTPLAWPT